jgi:hypothetical protein
LIWLIIIFWLRSFINMGIKPTVLNWIVDFLRNRFQRVKLDSDGYSDFLHVPAGVPQGTKLGPWLFLAI